MTIELTGLLVDQSSRAIQNFFFALQRPAGRTAAGKPPTSRPVDPFDTDRPTMRLTTKGRFAVTAMIDVAMHGTKGPVTLARRFGSAEDLAFLLGAAVRQAAPRRARRERARARRGLPSRASGGRSLRCRRDSRRRRADRRDASAAARRIARKTATLHDPRALGQPECAHLLVPAVVNLAQLVAAQDKNGATSSTTIAAPAARKTEAETIA